MQTEARTTVPESRTLTSENTAEANKENDVNSEKILNVTFGYVGTIEYTDEFVKAVEENPVLEGWGNKIVSVSPEK